MFVVVMVVCVKCFISNIIRNYRQPPPRPVTGPDVLSRFAP